MYKRTAEVSKLHPAITSWPIDE